MNELHTNITETSLLCNYLSGCSDIPVVENAEVAESSKKDTYSEGDKLEYQCLPGYTSLKKNIFKCINDEWTKERGDKCSREYIRNTHTHTHNL